MQVWKRRFLRISLGFGLIVWPLGAVSQESAADSASAPTYAELAQREVGAQLSKS